MGQLARGARTAKPANLAALQEPRRTATLTALFQTLETTTPWNSTYIQAATDQLTQEGWSISDADFARVSPLLLLLKARLALSGTVIPNRTSA